MSIFVEFVFIVNIKSSANWVNTHILQQNSSSFLFIYLFIFWLC